MSVLLTRARYPMPAKPQARGRCVISDLAKKRNGPRAWTQARGPVSSFFVARPGTVAGGTGRRS
jgi:hypothetical protein